MNRGMIWLLVFTLLLPCMLSADATYPAVTIRDNGTKWVGEPMSLDVKDLDIRDFFRFIADISKLNLIIDPSVKGTVTMKVHDVPWDQLLDIVCRMNGLGYELSGNVVGVKELRGM